GILVNITAGLDLSLGEYAAVGEIIEAFASDEATVKVGAVIDPDMLDELHVTVVATGKVGAVIDPDMLDELHVTVVATGLGSRNDKPVKVVDNTIQTAA